MKKQCEICGIKKCICKEIRIISNACKFYIDKLHSLQTNNYNKKSINYKSIDYFIPSTKNKNDNNNKMR